MLRTARMNIWAEQYEYAEDSKDEYLGRAV